MKNSIYVIVTSGGKGLRFKKGKTGKPKQYLMLKGKPVILHSLKVFQKIPEVKGIYISADSEYFSFLHTLSSKHKITKLKALVEGGKTRFESVRNAFNQVNCRLNDTILIHDAARPNISAVDIKSLLKDVRKYSEVIPAVKISDTVKKTDGKLITETIPRDNLWLVQTPQAFRYDVLSRAYIVAGSEASFTDEAALVESAGFKVYISEGNRNNIKITTEEDIKLLKKIM